MSFGSSKKKTSSNSQQDPWDETVPFLKDYVGLAGEQGGIGISPDQQQAISALKNNAAMGNPFTQQIAGAADRALNYGADGSGQQTQNDAYGALQNQLGGYANGQYTDIMNNPQLMALVNQAGTDAANKVNAQFAGAGRDLSGANQMAVGKGVTQAELPYLLDQFNKQQSNQMDAAKSLYSAGNQTATTNANLGAQNAAINTSGVGLAGNALDALNYGATNLFNLDQQVKGVPYQDMAQLLALMQPVAQLGSQTQGTQKSKASGFGISLSDERAKEAVEQIGEMADGTPIHRWKYKGDHTIHVGPMAQDVEKKAPGAVIDGPGGYKYVNMDAATRKAADIMKHRRGKK